LAPEAIWSVAVAGVDGCREGWIAVVRRDESNAVQHCETIVESRRVEDAVAVAIDIPHALSATGEFRCDSPARSELQSRGSTIFNAPTRACLVRVEDYPSNKISIHRGAKTLSRQALDC
jgi:predicted RNase H-like nuclease